MNGIDGHAALGTVGAAERLLSTGAADQLAKLVAALNKPLTNFHVLLQDLLEQRGLVSRRLLVERLLSIHALDALHLDQVVTLLLHQRIPVFFPGRGKHLFGSEPQRLVGRQQEGLAVGRRHLPPGGAGSHSATAWPPISRHAEATFSSSDS